MKKRHLLVPFAGTALLLAACDQQVGESPEPVATEVAMQESRPAPPSADATAELARQAVGQKLLGNTAMLKGDAFEPADLATAPEYYLAYYSASW